MSYNPPDRFSGLKVLDTGCGAGRHAIILALMGADVTAVDLSPENLRLCNKFKRYYRLKNIRFIQHDLMKPFKSSRQFDLISAHLWIHHAKNPSAVLRNITPLLRNKGRFYLNAYCSGTFRFFTAQIARSVLRRGDFSLMKKLVVHHFPMGFKEFDNPKDVFLENLFDDYLIPYCNTTTYDVVMNDLKKLGCMPITTIPEIEDIHGLDNTSVAMGFEKKDHIVYSGRLLFTRPIDEFREPLPPIVVKSAKLAKKTISYLNRLNNRVTSCSFSLGLYRIRAMTNKITDTREKHKVLQSYLDLVLSKSLKNLSMIYDTYGLYKK